MGGLFGSSKKADTAPAPPPAPTVDNSAAQLEASAEEQRQAALRGRSSTVLTSGTGTDLGSTSKTLLGN